MKNIFFTSIFLLFVLISCNSDSTDAAPTAPAAGTLKKITEKVYYSGGGSSGGSESTVDFVYENGVLSSMNSGVNKAVLTYNGDKISEIKIYQNNVLRGTNVFTYNGSNLMKVENNDNDEKTEFTYTNGVLATEKSSYKNGSTWTVLDNTSYTFNSTGNVVQTKRSFSSSTLFTQNHEYDDKNGVYNKMNPYLRYVVNAESFDSKSENNLTKTFSVEQGSAPMLQNNYLILYNAADYPISIKKFNVQNGANTLISECEIQYN